jgi:hypothetical protein
MNCPTCGLVNPSQAIRCDCGFDFQKEEPSATVGWRTNLTWSQRLAAFWSIFWPSLIAWMLLTLTWAVLKSSRNTGNSLWFASIGSNVVLFVVQGILTHRLVQKNYRSFHVEVIRDNGQNTRELSVVEAGWVWLWMLGPQIAFLLTVSILVWSYRTRLPGETLNSITSLSLWLRLLLVGPYAVDLAMQAKYQGFRLQAYGRGPQ